MLRLSLRSPSSSFSATTSSPGLAASAAVDYIRARVTPGISPAAAVVHVGTRMLFTSVMQNGAEAGVWASSNNDIISFDSRSERPLVRVKVCVWVCVCVCVFRAAPLVRGKVKITVKFAVSNDLEQS